MLSLKQSTGNAPDNATINSNSELDELRKRLQEKEEELKESKFPIIEDKIKTLNREGAIEHIATLKENYRYKKQTEKKLIFWGKS